MKDRKDTTNKYCTICKNYHDFAPPKDLFEALVNHELVIFAGAGISTENKNVIPYTLYEDILEELGDLPDPDTPFSEVMSKYCKKMGDKRALIDRIRDRIDYVQSFPELYGIATAFHEQLARLPCIDEIVTTNWDDFFEVICHATPFVYEPDMAFWDRPKRKVLKLHGSINNLGSIVATSEDYEKRYKSLNTGLIGSQLKLMIANRRIAFVGYSFGDEDFNRIHSFVRTQLGDFMKKSYIITLDESNDAKWRALGLEPIYTAGDYFIQVLADELELKGCTLPNRRIDNVNKEVYIMLKEHHELAEKINFQDQPEVTLCLSYQDGILHAFSHFLHHINYGESLCKNRIKRTLMAYESIIKKKRAERRWFDVAYIMGYLNGYTFVLLNEEEIRHFPPRYLDLGLKQEFRTFKEYRDSLKINTGRNKSITNYASRFVKGFPDKSLVVHHIPFL